MAAPKAVLYPPRPLIAYDSWTKRMNDFTDGFKLPLQAIRLIAQSPRLRRLATLCFLMTLLAAGAVLFFVGANVGRWLETFWAQPAAWYEKAFWYALWVGAFLLLSLVGLQVVPLLALAPLQDFLSEATDVALGRQAPVSTGPSQWLSNTANAIFLNLTRLAVYFAGLWVLLILNLIPGLGSIAFTACAVLWNIFWLAFEFLSGVMARFGLRFRDVVAALWAQKPLSMGFGSAIYLMLWFPIINLFFIPVAVVAATLLYWNLAKEGYIPLPPVSHHSGKVS